MIDLQNFFDGLFLEKAITYSRLVNYAQDNAASMTNNNPGLIYDDAILATNAAAANLETMIVGKTGDKGARQGGTASKNIARTNAEVYVANNIGWARSLFGGKNDPRFIETFPQLMKSFYPVTDQVFEENLVTLTSKANTYIVVLGVDFFNTLTTLVGDLQDSTSAHSSQTVKVRGDIVTVQMAADVLSDQLTDNVLLVARHNRRSQTASKLYFNTTLLYPVKQREYYDRTIEPHTEDDICPITYAADKIVEFINKGAVKLTFGMKLAGDKVGATIELLPGQEVSKPYSFFFTNGSTFYVINSEGTKGMFHLEIKI